MFLLIRRISAYSGADVLLGVFVEAQQAEAARDAYLARYDSDPASDPWHEQAYKPAGLAAEDLVVRRIEGPGIDGAEVFVVSGYSEAFGQILREFDSVHGSETAAGARIAELEAAEGEFTGYAICQRARVGAPLSDAPEEQPHRLLWAKLLADSP